MVTNFSEPSCAVLFGPLCINDGGSSNAKDAIYFCVFSKLAHPPLPNNKPLWPTVFTVLPFDEQTSCSSHGNRMHLILILNFPTLRGKALQAWENIEHSRWHVGSNDEGVGEEVQLVEHCY